MRPLTHFDAQYDMVERGIEVYARSAYETMADRLADLVVETPTIADRVHKLETENAILRERGPLTHGECHSLIVTASEALRELREQRRLTAFVLGENKALHHRDGNPQNNDLANLEIVEIEESAEQARILADQATNSA